MIDSLIDRFGGSDSDGRVGGGPKDEVEMTTDWGSGDGGGMGDSMKYGLCIVGVYGRAL